MIRTWALTAAITFAATPGHADCTAELTDIDRQLAAAAREQPQLIQVLQQLRDQGATACKAGNESSASANFTTITMMLELQARQGPGNPPAAVDERKPQAPPRAAPEIKQNDPGGSGSRPWASRRWWCSMSPRSSRPTTCSSSRCAVAAAARSRCCGGARSRAPRGMLHSLTPPLLLLPLHPHTHPHTHELVSHRPK